MSDSLRPHESQHARPPCPSPTPGVYPDSCPSLPAPVFLGFHCGSAGKKSTCSVGNLGLIPGLGRSPGEEKGYPLQYSCLENSMDCIVHGVTKSRTQLSDFTFTFQFHALEKEMATHSSVLAWRIPGTGKPGGLLSMGSHRVGHD